MDTHTVTLLCHDCDGHNADDCNTCHGASAITRTVAALDIDGSPEDALPFDGDGDGDDTEELFAVGEYRPRDIDDEPADIDDDRFTNPYTGACEDDGYDTGSDW